MGILIQLVMLYWHLVRCFPRNNGGVVLYRGSSEIPVLCVYLQLEGEKQRSCCMEEWKIHLFDWEQLQT